MLTRTAAVCVAFICVALNSGVFGCYSSDFTCDNGQCLPSVSSKCNGIAECADGSDEDPAMCNAGAINVTIGTKFVVRAQYKWEYSGLSFTLCNDNNNCTSLPVSGYSPRGQLCNYMSWPGGCGAINSGEIMFGVERRKDGLSVWLYGHPVARRWFAAPKDYGRLLIRPTYWYDDMALEVTKDVGACNEFEFQCSDGQCLSSRHKCDGTEDCFDGEDEDPAVCNAGIDLTGGLVTAKVQYREEHGPIHFLVCNGTACNNLRIIDCALSGGWLASFRYDSCNTQGAYCNGGAGSRCAEEERFPSGTLVFTVQLGNIWSNKYQDVRIKIGGSYETSMSAALGHTELRIRPENWGYDMPVKYSVSPLTTTTLPTPKPTQPATTATTPSTPPPPPPPTTAATTRLPPAGPTTASPPVWPPSPAPSTCAPAYAYLLIPVAGDCSQYRVCISGRSWSMRCAAPRQFNYQKQTCDVASSTAQC